jgi:hypothetical protein
MVYKLTSFKWAGRSFKFKEPLEYDILPVDVLRKRYKLTSLNKSSGCGSEFFFGGTEEYDWIYITGDDEEDFHNHLYDILVILIDESKNLDNVSPQDQWFRENVTELKGDKNELNETKAY